MKNLVWIIVLFAVAIALALTANVYSGNVYIVIEQYMLRMNLHLFIIALFVAVVVLYVLLRLLAGTLNLPGRFGRLGAARRERKAESSLNAAGVAFFEGRFQKAEQEAAKVLENRQAGEKRQLALILAAHAADCAGDLKQRDSYLELFSKLPEKMQVSRYLLSAESALNAGDTAAAEANLAEAAKLNGSLTRLVRLQLRLALEQNNALEVLDKTDKLRRANAVSEQAAGQYRTEAYRRLLDTAAESGDAAAVKACLKRIPEELKSSGLCVSVAQTYEQAGQYAKAVEWVGKHYPHNNQSALLPLFARSVRYLDERGQRKAVDMAESWLKSRPDDAKLLLLLGELAYDKQLWGKAKGYLEASINRQDSVQARLALAKVLDAAEESEAAEQQRRQAVSVLEDEAE